MALELLDLPAIQSVGANLVDRLHGEGDQMIDHLNTVGAQLIDRAMAQVSNLLNAALNALAATESKAALDVQATIQSLDGWTAIITPQGPLGQITGPIEIRLNKPKPQGE